MVRTLRREVLDASPGQWRLAADTVARLYVAPRDMKVQKEGWHGLRTERILRKGTGPKPRKSCGSMEADSLSVHPGPTAPVLQPSPSPQVGPCGSSTIPWPRSIRIHRRWTPCPRSPRTHPLTSSAIRPGATSLWPGPCAADAGTGSSCCHHGWTFGWTAPAQGATQADTACLTGKTFANTLGSTSLGMLPLRQTAVPFSDDRCP